MQLPPLPPCDSPALIGVSGGRDSVALLHALQAHGFRDLIVCHLDHGLRAESAADAKFVRALARRLGLRCVVQRADVATAARSQKQSLETAARAARYAFFAAVAARRKCPRLFLAHHADDQVETFLFHLLRGSGSAGLGSMAPVSTRTIHGSPLEIHRPLLGVWREEIDRYITDHALPFREDASNADPRHTRNRLRHQLLPLMERTLDRDVRASLWRAAELLRAESDALEAMLPLSPDEARLPVATLRALPLALQRRQIHAWLRAHGVPQIGFTEVERVRSLLDGPRAKVNLPAAHHARRRAGVLFLEQSSASGS